MTADDVRGAYRHPVPPWRTLMPVLALATLVTAVVAALSDRWWAATVSALWCAWASLQSWRPPVTVVTDNGVRLRHGMRSRSLGWADVAEVVPAAREDDCPCLHLIDGEVVALRGLPPETVSGLAQLHQAGD